MRFSFPILFIALLATASCTSHTEHYDALIEVIKAKDLPVGEVVRFHLDKLDDVNTLRDLPSDHVTERGEGAGDLWAVSYGEGEWYLYIEEEDRGHGGEYGKVYSESGALPFWDHDEWGEFWTIGDQIDDHWWEIEYRLD